ncbi:MAG: hypothetical protein A3F10_00955 [Coxiella sp. RIFCSPHIGHO2_12_FULL_42_15]|nr:MAG: hypothetical protein A3F10_00955 [Coxiella sp. RIFCSPHIGHO2_12_FULL_42_15]
MSKTYRTPLKPSPCFSLCGGLTLIEVVVVLGIITILVVVALPTFIHYVRDSRLKAAGELIYETLTIMRAEAIRRQQNVTLVLQSGSTWCVGGTTSSSCDCLVADNCNLGQILGSAYPNTTLSIASGLGPAVLFGGQRGSVNLPGTLTLGITGSSSQLSITISALGSLTLCSNNLSGLPKC